MNTPVTSSSSATPASPAIRYHGSKWRLYPWLSQFIPAHEIYVEPFGGSAAVLLQKPRVRSEVYNDLDNEIVNFFQVLRDPVLARELRRQISLTPYSRSEFENAINSSLDPVEQARRTAIRASMGFGSGGASKATTGFRSDSTRRYVTAALLWSEYPEKLRAVGERLAGVLIESKPAIEVIQIHDHEDTFHFVDPPYVTKTREMKGRVYKHEMTDGEHADLLATLKSAKGSVMLCGYDSDLYDLDWERHQTRSRISAGRGTGVRIETIWLNQNAVRHGVRDLFTKAPV